MLIGFPIINNVVIPLSRPWKSPAKRTSKVIKYCYDTRKRWNGSWQRDRISRWKRLWNGSPQRSNAKNIRHQVSVTAGGLHKTHLPLTQWFLAFCFVCQDKWDISAVQLVSQLRTSYKIAWYMLKRIRMAMGQRDETPISISKANTPSMKKFICPGSSGDRATVS